VSVNGKMDYEESHQDTESIFSVYENELNHDVSNNSELAGITPLRRSKSMIAKRKKESLSQSLSCFGLGKKKSTQNANMVANSTDGNKAKQEESSSPRPKESGNVTPNGALSQEGGDTGNEASSNMKNNEIMWGAFIGVHRNKNCIMVHGRKVHGYTNLAFNRLGRENPVRQLAIWINEWVWFDRIVIFLIVVNSAALGLIDYTYVEKADNLDQKPIQNIYFEKCEIFFTVAFTIELLIKVIAMGVFLNDNCYLREPWNWLDAVVVISSILAALPQVSNVSALRTFRLFRPLRSLSALPSMRVLV